MGLLSGNVVDAVTDEEMMLALVRKDGGGALGSDGAAKANWGLCPTNGVASSELFCPNASRDMSWKSIVMRETRPTCDMWLRVPCTPSRPTFEEVEAR